MVLVYESLSDSSNNNQEEERRYSKIIGSEEENGLETKDILNNNKTSK